MMGGIGSGRTGWRGKVEHYRSIDANRLNAAGSFTPGCSGGLRWMCGDDEAASISFRFEAGQLRLIYRVRQYGGAWSSVEQPVAVIRTPCRFGGDRAYFVCPGVVAGRHCGRRVVKLFGAGRYFLCRQCHGLAYGSQSEDLCSRFRRAADKKRLALGGDPGMEAMPPARPKGMWRRTFARKMAELQGAEDRASDAFWRYVEARFDTTDTPFFRPRP